MAYRVNTVMTGASGAPYFSRLHFESQPGDTTPFATDTALAVESFWVALKGNLAAGMSITVDPEVQLVNDLTQDVEQVFIASTTTITTDGPGEPLPSMAQGLVQIRTGVFVGGREIRGRMFVPRLTENDSTGGRPTAGIRTTVAGAFEDLLIAHTPPVGVLGKAGFTPATSATVWGEWSYLSTRRD